MSPVSMVNLKSSGLSFLKDGTFFKRGGSILTIKSSESSVSKFCFFVRLYLCLFSRVVFLGSSLISASSAGKLTLISVMSSCSSVSSTPSLSEWSEW